MDFFETSDHKLYTLVLRDEKFFVNVVNPHLCFEQDFAKVKRKRSHKTDELYEEGEENCVDEDDEDEREDP